MAPIGIFRMHFSVKEEVLTKIIGPKTISVKLLRDHGLHFDKEKVIVERTMTQSDRGLTLEIKLG